MKFTEKHRGCYADGGFGQEHIRTMLDTVLLSATGDEALNPEIHKSLKGLMPDDAWDEIEALEILQDNTEEGLVWVMDSGDLLLIKEDDLEV